MEEKFENELLDLLKRFPWASEKMLQNFYGSEPFGKMREAAGDKIVSIQLPDGVTYYSAAPANYRLIPGIRRREMVRLYTVNEYGYEAIKEGESPCFNADLRFYNKETNRWIRVCGDLGNISPDSMLFSIIPPVFGRNLEDIILTVGNLERAELLGIQIENTWKKAPANTVRIITWPGYDTVIPELSENKPNTEYDPYMDCYPKLPGVIKKPYSDTGKKKVSIQEIRSIEIAKQCANLTENDIQLLNFIACNPFMKDSEIALLFAGDSSHRDDVCKCAIELRRHNETMDLIKRLMNHKLLKRIANGPMKNTYIPTWQSIDFLAAYYGTIPAFMRKFSQIPLKEFKESDFTENRKTLDEPFDFFDSHCSYKQRWGVVRPEHQNLVKEFSAALLCGARSLKAMHDRNVQVTNMKTISSCMKIVSRIRKRKQYRWLIPDGSCDIYYSDNESIKRMKIFFEIERNTNHKDTVLQKLEKYRKILPAAEQFYKGYDEIAVVFFYEDTEENRSEVLEKTTALLEKMKLYRIKGYVGLMSDAKNVPAGWINKHGPIEESTCGYMYVYGRIWRTSMDKDLHRKHTLFDYHRKENQEYKNLAWVRWNLDRQGKLK